MNKWNRLLYDLDRVFGFKDKKKSTFRKVSQTYDERTNEHVITIEYRVRRGGDQVTSRKPVEKRKSHQMALLRKMVSQG